VCGKTTSGEPPDVAATAGQVVRVRVLNGSVAGGSLPPAQPKLAGDVDVAPAGQFWCASGVPVPAWSTAGSPLTVVAWLLTSGGAGGTVEDSASALFNGGGPNPKDCCSASECGSCSGAMLVGGTGELASMADLEVTIPDGANAGIYTATAVSPLRWDVTIGGATYSVSGAGAGLVVQGPSGAARSTALACNPFSATFPGKVFGATADVVVTLA